MITRANGSSSISTLKDFTKVVAPWKRKTFSATWLSIKTPVPSFSGCSVDNAELAQELLCKGRIELKLLADTDAKVSEAYGSVENDDGKKWSARNTFIINPEGKIAQYLPE